MTVRRLFAVFVLTCGLVPSCSAQAPQYVGIPSANFNFFAASQQADEWCWAASIQMILNYYSIPIAQSQIVQRVYGAVVNQPGSDAAINASLNGWAINVQGAPHIVRSVVAQGLPAPVVLLDQLNRGRPILLTFITGPNSGHAVVITAASYRPTQAGPYITSLVTRDPWPSQANVAADGRVEIDEQGLAQFAHLVRNHWLVDVQ